MKNLLMGALEMVGGVDSDKNGDSPPASQPPMQSVSPAAILQPAASTPMTSAGVADPKMVAKIRENVTSPAHSTRFNTFLLSLERAKTAFPNDLRNATVAALAFSGLTSQQVGDELKSSIAAALMEAESQINADIGRQRDALAHDLDGEEGRLTEAIRLHEAELAEVQRKLGEARGAHAQIAVRRATGKNDIDGRQAAALASLATVRGEMDTIKSMLP